MTQGSSESEGTRLTIWERGDMSITLNPEQENEIVGALKLWHTSGKTRDTLLDLTTRCGARYLVAASDIQAVAVSTAAQRALALVHEKRADDEDAMHRREAGYIESE